MRILLTVLLAALIAAGMGGCASSASSGAFSRSEVGRQAEIQTGVVIAVRLVRIEGTQTGVGTLSGAAVGGIAGSSISHGRGSAVGTILGAVAGGVIGSAAEKGATRQKGLEITIKLDNGRTIAVVQGADVPFRVGDHVRLATIDGRTRVEHAR